MATFVGGQNMTLSPTKALELTKAQQESINGITKSMEAIFKDAGVPVIKVGAIGFLGRVISFSPILTGRYVKSHKVGINVKNPEVADFSDTFQANRRSAAASALSEGQRIVGHSEKPRKIIVSNSLFYAAQVEYTGWKNTGPYFPYTKARLSYGPEFVELIKRYKAFMKLLAERVAAFGSKKKTIRSGTPMGPAEILNRRDQWISKEQQHLESIGLVTGYGLSEANVFIKGEPTYKPPKETKK